MTPEGVYCIGRGMGIVYMTFSNRNGVILGEEVFKTRVNELETI